MDQAAMLRIRDRLQSVEDELVAAGFDEFIVATDAGTWTWRTVKRARAEHGKGPLSAGMPNPSPSMRVARIFLALVGMLALAACGFNSASRPYSPGPDMGAGA